MSRIYFKLWMKSLVLHFLTVLLSFLNSFYGTCLLLSSNYSKRVLKWRISYTNRFLKLPNKRLWPGTCEWNNQLEWLLSLSSLFEEQPRFSKAQDMCFEFVCSFILKAICFQIGKSWACADHFICVINSNLYIEGGKEKCNKKKLFLS